MDLESKEIRWAKEFAIKVACIWKIIKGGGVMYKITVREKIRLPNQNCIIVSCNFINGIRFNDNQS